VFDRCIGVCLAGESDILLYLFSVTAVKNARGDEALGDVAAKFIR